MSVWPQTNIENITAPMMAPWQAGLQRFRKNGHCGLRVHSRRQVNDELRKHSNGDAGLMRKHARARANGGNPVGVLS